MRRMKQKRQLYLSRRMTLILELTRRWSLLRQKKPEAEEESVQEETVTENSYGWTSNISIWWIRRELYLATMWNGYRMKTEIISYTVMWMVVILHILQRMTVSWESNPQKELPIIILIRMDIW